LGANISQYGYETFKKVERDYTIKIATLAREAGVPYLAVLSATGTNSESWIFAIRVKGEMENEIVKLDFPTFSIFKPCMLLTDEHENASIYERIAKFTFSWLDPVLPEYYRPLEIATLAEAISTTQRQIKITRKEQLCIMFLILRSLQ
jgi:hypothetical protein